MREKEKEMKAAAAKMAIRQLSVCVSVLLVGVSMACVYRFIHALEDWRVLSCCTYIYN